MSKIKLAKFKRLLNIKMQQLEIKRQELAVTKQRLDTETQKADLVRQQQARVLSDNSSSMVGVAELSQIQHRSQRLQQLLQQRLEIVALAKKQHDTMTMEIGEQHAAVKAWEKYVAMLENQIAVSVATAEIVLADDSYLMN